MPATRVKILSVFKVAKTCSSFIKYFFFLILLSILAFAANAQRIEPVVTYNTTVTDNNLIAYSPGKKLSIEDFKATPQENGDVVAITSSGFAMKAGYRNKEGKITLLISVSCTFDRQQSWMNEAGKNSYILEHEQHHFDISYLSTLLFIEKLKKATLTVDNYKEELQSINKSAIEEMRQLQQLYDNETSNGKQKETQAAWNKRISLQLAATGN